MIEYLVCFLAGVIVAPVFWLSGFLILTALLTPPQARWRVTQHGPHRVYEPTDHQEN
jgi:hypothetical protein